MTQRVFKEKINNAKEICSECGNKYGSMPKGHICGWWEGTCDICGNNTICQEYK